MKRIPIIISVILVSLTHCTEGGGGLGRSVEQLKSSGDICSIKSLDQDKVAPSAPSNLKAQSIDPSSMLLTWQKSDDDISSDCLITYNVCYEKTGEGSCGQFRSMVSKQGKGGISATENVVISELDSKENYTFHIKAKDRSGKESKIVSVAGFTQSKGSAGNPQFVPTAGTIGTDTRISLSSLTAGAIICYRSDGNTPSCNEGLCSNGLQYSSPLNIGTGTIKAIACKKGFDNSEIIEASYNIDSVSPSSVGNYSGYAVDATTLSISWDKASDNYSEPSQISYELCLSEAESDCDSFSVNSLIPAGSNSYRVNGLTGLSSYWLSIRAVDSVGNKGPVSKINLTTPTAGTVSSVNFLPSREQISKDELINLSSNTSGSFICFTTNGANPECDRDQCSAGNKYESGVIINNGTIKARACKLGYDSSGVITKTFNVDQEAPSKVTSLSAEVLNSNSVKLTWSASTDNLLPSSEISYEICQTESSTGCDTFNVTYNTSAGASNFTINSLFGLTQYRFLVRARDRSDNISITEIVTVSTPVEGTVGSVVANPTQSVVAANTMLNLSTSTAGSTICYGIGSQPACEKGVCTSGNLYSGSLQIANDQSLNAIACKKGFYDSPLFSKDLNVDSEAPVVVADFALTSNAFNKVELNWSASSDNYSDESDIYYEICRATTSGGCNQFQATIATTKGATSYTDTGKIGLTNYYYKIRAVDSVGNKTNPSSSSIQTPAEGTVADPVFSLTPGQYRGPQSLTAQSGTNGAKTCLTNDATEPTCNLGNCLNGSEVSNVLPHQINSTKTIKLRSCKLGFTDSNVITGSFEILPYWLQATYFKPFNTIENNVTGFGSKIAISGNMLAVKGYDDSNVIGVQSNLGPFQSGSVRSQAISLYEKSSNDQWNLVRYIKGPSGVNLSYEFAINGDWLIAGTNNNQVIAYSKNGGNWSATQTISPNWGGDFFINDYYGPMRITVAAQENFGTTSIYLKDDTLIIAAMAKLYCHSNCMSSKDYPEIYKHNVGFIFIFELENGVWQQKQVLLPIANNLSYYGSFGLDGDYLAFHATDAHKGIFLYKKGVSNWTEIDYLDYADIFGNYQRTKMSLCLKNNSLSFASTKDNSVHNYSITNDKLESEGKHQLIIPNNETIAQVSYNCDSRVVFSLNDEVLDRTIYYDDTNSSIEPTPTGGFPMGSVIVYEKSENSWSQKARIKPSNLDGEDAFGQFVIKLFGNRLFVVSHGEDSDLAGVYHGQFTENNNRESVGAVYEFKYVEP